MAFSFYNTRKAKSFEHKPIYWDSRKEELSKRIETIKRELKKEEGGNVDDSVEDDETWVESEARKRISDSLYSNASHLRRQRNLNIDKQARTDKIIKLLIAIAALCGLFWYFYY